MGVSARIAIEPRREDMKMAKEKVKGASMNPDDMSEGGLVDNVSATWKECRFELGYGPGRQQGADAPTFHITMDVEGGEEAESYYSCGKASDWEPSPDGTELIPIGAAAGINKSSNLGLLIASLTKAGYPKDKLTTNATDFEGLVCHMTREKAPERVGLPPQPRADGRVFEKTILLVDKIIKLPWEKQGKGGPSFTTTAKTEGKEEMGQKATDIVVGIMGENPKGLDKPKLIQKVYTKLKADPDRNSILAMVQRDEFLSEGPWEYDGKLIKM